MPQTIEPVSRGIWAGVLATGPMTLAMFRMFRDLPAGQKSPLPPATLTYEMGEKAGVTNGLRNENIESTLSMLSHLGYGASTGAVYSLAVSRLPGSPLLKGSLYGLGVWAASYLGWIPLFGMRAQAPRMTKERNLMMIAAHVVWGMSLGYADGEMRKRGGQMLAGHKKAPRAE